MAFFFAPAFVSVGVCASLCLRLPLGVAALFFTIISSFLWIKTHFDNDDREIAFAERKARLKYTERFPGDLNAHLLVDGLQSHLGSKKLSSDSDGTWSLPDEPKTHA